MAKKKRYQYAAADEQWEQERPSRSQKKRDSTALQKLGEELVALPLNKVKQLPISAELYEALELMARINDREGRRRQMQYIGKLMRECSVDELRAELDSVRQGHNEVTAHFHHAERLRETLLLANAEEQLELLKSWPEAERLEVLDLVKRAIKENSTATKRALFRKIHTVLQEQN